MLSQVGPKKSKAVNFLDIILLEFSLINLDGNTILGVPASKRVPYVPSFI